MQKSIHPPFMKLIDNKLEDGKVEFYQNDISLFLDWHPQLILS